MRKKFTNHCASKTTVRKLKKAKILSSEHIANITGHKSIHFLNDYNEADEKEAGTKVGPDQLGPPVWVGSTRIDSDQLGSNKKIKIK